MPKLKYNRFCDWYNEPLGSFSIRGEYVDEWVSRKDAQSWMEEAFQAGRKLDFSDDIARMVRESRDSRSLFLCFFWSLVVLFGSTLAASVISEDVVATCLACFCYPIAIAICSLLICKYGSIIDRYEGYSDEN